MDTVAGIALVALALAARGLYGYHQRPAPPPAPPAEPPSHVRILRP